MRKAVPNITDLFLKGAKEGLYWDGGLPGFGVRIGKKRKTFLVLIASGRRKSIGHYPLLSLAEARKTARGMLAEKVLGKVHPLHMAFDDAKKDYLEECAQKLRPITIKDLKFHGFSEPHMASLFFAQAVRIFHVR